MAKDAAKKGDRITATDTHVVVPPAGPPAPAPFPFDGPIDGALSPDVLIEHQPAAVKGSTATSSPHVPPAGAFQRPPSHRGTVQAGSGTVLINGLPAARDDDPAVTCNDPDDAPVGRVVAASTVIVGG